MKTVIEMAREAGILEPIDLLDSNQWRQDTIRELERFAELIRADAISDEREACAVIAETAADCLQNSTFDGVANAIRARGNT